MKKLFLSFFILFGFCVNTMASDYNSNLIIYAEDGQKFYLFLNGIRQNMLADKLVKVTNIPLFYVNIRVVFEDTMIKPVYKKSVAVQDDRGQDLEIRYNITKSDENIRSLVLAISMPRLVAPKPTPDMMVVPFNSKIMPPIVTPPKTSEGTTHSPGVGLSVNDKPFENTGVLRPGDAEAKNNGTVITKTTTTTTTTYSTTSSTQVPVDATPYSSGTPEPTKYVMPGYHGPVGCDGWPMNPTDFEAAKNSVSKQSFDDVRLTTAKQIASYNCLTTDQVHALLKLFSFDSNRLSFAKFAYAHTIDIGNYFKENDTFSFSSNVEELNRFISK